LRWWTDGEANGTRGWSRYLATACKFGSAQEYMESEDREWLASLPERVTIYRGQFAGRRAGISWSTGREVAEFFGQREIELGLEAVVLSGRVKRSNIIAAFTGRKESEVLVLPGHVRNRREERIPDGPIVRPSAWGKTP
jgi:hypothetical protein